MKLKNLLIALAITLSPVIHTGPVKWIKDNAVPLAIGIAGVSAAVIYMSQADDVVEQPNHSPTIDQLFLDSQQLLQLARRSKSTSSRLGSTMENGDIVTNSGTHKQTITFKYDSIIPNRGYNPNARCQKSCLKNTDYTPISANELSNPKPLDTTSFKEALALAIATDRDNLNQNMPGNCIASLCAANPQICAFYNAKSLSLQNEEITLQRRVEWADELLGEL